MNDLDSLGPIAKTRVKAEIEHLLRTFFIDSCMVSTYYLMYDK